MEALGLVFGFSNVLALISLASVILLLLVYLLRPKPFRKVIPSLIFIESSKKKTSFTSFFQRFVKDWQMLIQALVLTLLGLAAAGFFLELDISARAAEVVCVIDASASMKADYDGKARFDAAVKACRDGLGIKNSIIAVKESPEIITKDAGIVGARRAAGSLDATDSSSNIWDGLMLVQEAAEPGAKVILASDMLDSKDRDLDTAIEILSLKGYETQTVFIGSDIGNVGIIGYEILPGPQVKVSVKNYGTQAKRVGFNHYSQTIDISPGKISSAVLPVSYGKTMVELSEHDGFMPDNQIYLYIPESSERKVLIITSQRGTALQKALKADKSLIISYAEPPIIPKIDQDVIVIDHVAEDQMVSGIKNQVDEAVYNGAALIVSAQEDLGSLDILYLLPVCIDNYDDSSIPIENNALGKSIEDISFGQQKGYFNAEICGNTTAAVWASTADGIPVIATGMHGEGTVLYYGLFDSDNSFRLSSDYPVFWYEAMRLIDVEENPGEVNLKVGDVITGNYITGPEGIDAYGHIKTVRAGYYESGGKTYAVSFIDPKESDVSTTRDQGSYQGEQNSSKVTQNVSLAKVLVILALLIMCLEILYLKKRGDF